MILRGILVSVEEEKEENFLLLYYLDKHLGPAMNWTLIQGHPAFARR